jgi:P4 family phage/plasmid primase-like protien
MLKSSTIQSQYKNLFEFLMSHQHKDCKDKNSGCHQTHTRIPDKSLNIYGGSYCIQPNELPIFYDLYYKNVFEQNKPEHLTERQLDNGPIAIDFDFRYDYSVENKIHTKEHIQDMITLYLEELKNLYIFTPNTPFDIFIFEKPHVNRVKDKNITKDGIHMIIGIQGDGIIGTILRDKIIEDLSLTWEDLPLTHEWSNVLDEGISKKITNWQLYGSKKPGNETYELLYHYSVIFDNKSNNLILNEKKIKDFDLKNNFHKLSVQNTNIPCFELNPSILEEYNKRKNSQPEKNTKKKKQSNIVINSLNNEIDDENDDEIIGLNDIINKEILEKAVEQMLSQFNNNEYEIRETHYYTQILPEKYYEPGSHELNRKVAFALKHTDERLFLSWVLLRSKASDFDYSTIPELYNKWKKHFNINKTQNIITRRSIMYMAKQDNYEEYLKVKESSLEYFADKSCDTRTEYDIALLMYQMYKDKYVCTNYKDKTWYVFNNHRWEHDEGLTLRLAISKDVYDIYNKYYDKLNNIQQENADNLEKNDGNANDEVIRNKIKNLKCIQVMLKKTNDKNNILREAAELFFDKNFERLVDTNKYLMCFNNGVVDFKNKVFREGHPQDYITLCTNLNYKKYDPNDEEMSKIGKQIIEFMNKLFPIQEVNTYMWEHLASCLIGINRNQTFNLYHGSGSNGKSMLTTLMSKTLGNYKSIVPVSLITDKRASIGQSSSEIMALKGIRYAVIQEPSKGSIINDGVLKELTGDENLQGRSLFKNTETYEPQFKLVVCTNTLFDVNTNDDGFWRRIRKVQFISKFINPGDNTRYETDYIYEKDTTLEDKLPILAPVFASMLVDKAFETEGLVKDCKTILEDSNKYKGNQDRLTAFIQENIQKTDNTSDKIKKQELVQHFNQWYASTEGYGGKKKPKTDELYEAMNKKFGNPSRVGWIGCHIIYPDNEEENEDDLINTLSH